ncbi:MAG TPA: alanine--tRNA ligase, partial [Phycisphaerales bacterium]|nr:alanine--tRNA ligase [Phycisphaerales bacterium]
GMGFERITRVLQGKSSNYDTDIWTPIFRAIQQKTGARAYQGILEDPIDIAYRVLADHVRCLTMAITDGATPGNEGRSYVLRRILRRAVRIARQTLGVQGPVLCELVPSVVDSLGEAFPELKKDPKRVAGVIRAEEEAFLKTIDRGIEHFREAASGERISAEDAFKLHDTYGFPIDLTCVMAEERGMTVDVAGFEKLMEQARETSRAGGSKEESFALTPGAIDELKRQGIKPTDDSHKYMPRPRVVKIQAVWNGSDFDNFAALGRRVAIILDETNHYAEQGGQVGDSGMLSRDYQAGFGRSESNASAHFRIEDTQKVGDYVLHIGRATDGVLRVGDRVQLKIDRKRRDAIQANHTGTHLLNFALREVIGDEVDQKGSLVADDRLRFDFSSSKAMKPEQIEQVENIVNEFIAKNLPVHAEVMPLEQAKSITGLRAVFGEKYPDPVRVVAIAPGSGEEIRSNPTDPKWRGYSIEFCGGTHLLSTGEARRFILAQEQALAAGVRRITALTGAAAVEAQQAGEALLAQLDAAQKLDGESLLRAFDDAATKVEQMTTGAAVKVKIAAAIDALREKVKAIRKQSLASSRDAVVEEARQLAETLGPNARATSFIVADVPAVPHADKDMLLVAMDVVRAKCADAAVMLFAVDHEERKVTIAAAVPKALIDRGLKAGDWVREVAKACGGGGGGRPDMAQAGGKEPEKLGYAMATAREFAAGKLG